jgi:uncharacterized protein
MSVFFPVAGIELNPLIPLGLAYIVGTLCSMAGVTGAFLLLPIQMTVFGFTSPSVSATNHAYNLFAGVGGPYRYAREGRLMLPLAGLMLAGTVPGIVGGMFIRVLLLPDPVVFKAFVAVVLLVLGVQVIVRAFGKGSRENQNHTNHSVFRANKPRFDWPRFSYSYGPDDHSINVLLIFGVALLVGLISGAYGMGGGALLSSFLVGVCGLPVHSTAGATLLTSFVSSITGTLSYMAFAHFSTLPLQAAPDWMLASLLGVGGLAGTYTGARLQKRVPGPVLAGMLGVLLLVIAVRYSKAFLVFLH